MINAEFFITKNGEILGFHIRGHSGMDEAGRDVVCAFVSSAAYMAANTVTDVLNVNAVAEAEDGDMYLMVDRKDMLSCRDIFEGLRLHLVNTEEQYPDYLQVNYTEV